MREGEAPSFFNPIEATLLVDLVEGLLKQHETGAGKLAVSKEDIGVIATYRKQAGFHPMLDVLWCLIHSLTLRTKRNKKDEQLEMQV